MLRYRIDIYPLNRFFGIFSLFLGLIVFLLAQFYDKKSILESNEFLLFYNSIGIQNYEFFNDSMRVILRKEKKIKSKDQFWIDLYDTTDGDLGSSQATRSFLGNSSAEELWNKLKQYEIRKTFEGESIRNLAIYFDEHPFYLRGLDDTHKTLIEWQIGKQQFGGQDVYVRQLAPETQDQVYLVANLANSLNILKQAELKLMQRNFFSGESFSQTQSIQMEADGVKLLRLKLSKDQNIQQGITIDSFLDKFSAEGIVDRDLLGRYTDFLKQFFKYKIKTYATPQLKKKIDSIGESKNLKLQLYDKVSKEIYRFDIQCNFAASNELSKSRCLVVSSWTQSDFFLEDSTLESALRTF